MKRFALIVGTLLTVGQLSAQGIPSADEVYRILTPQNERFQFIATAEGPAAMRLNPASAASSRGINLHYNLLVERGKILEHDVSLQNFLFNIAYRRSLDRSRDYHLNQYTVTLGLGIPEATFGASVNWLRSNLPSGSNGSIINLGVLLRPLDRFSIAAVKTNINQPMLGGRKRIGMNVAGLGVRPLEEVDRLTLAVEAALPNKGRLSNDATYRFGADALIVEGLRAYAVYEQYPGRNRNRFSVGINLYIPNVDFLYDAQFNESREYLSGVAGVTLSSERKKTIFTP
jgi:hypothetical protein